MTSKTFLTLFAAAMIGVTLFAADPHQPVPESANARTQVAQEPSDLPVRQGDTLTLEPKTDEEALLKELEAAVGRLPNTQAVQNGERDTVE